jgi:formate dehydrogenase accessory protein FdhE
MRCGRIFAAMVLSSGSNSGSSWQRRIERARELQNRASTAVEPSRFYEFVLRFQADVAEDLDAVFDPALPLRPQIDAEFAASKMALLLALASKHGPRELAEHAEHFRHANPPDWKRMMDGAISGQSSENALDEFFIRACLQPIAEKLQREIPSDVHYLRSVCPACGGLPQLSILRPEGEGASRSLFCSFCLREWAFRRIICPSCGEEDKEKLPRYSAPECGHVSVEACEGCMKYLKAVDMTVDGYAEPLVDEAAVAALDIWATERGYRKIVRNLLGF